MAEKREIPKNVEIEGSVLAAMLMRETARSDAIMILEAKDFAGACNRLIFRSFCEMNRRGDVVDLVSLVEFMRSYGFLERVGGAGKVVAAIDYPVPPNVVDYAYKLKRYTALREMLRICQDVGDKCYSGGAEIADELTSRFQSEVLNLGAIGSGGFVTKMELGEETLERYDALSRGDVPMAIETGFSDFDEALSGGFRGPKLIILAARPGVGKTALMVNLVRNQCRRGRTVGVQSLEMPRSDLDDRWVALDSGVSLTKLSEVRGLRSNDADWVKVTNAIAEQGRWSLMIDDRAADIGELCRRCKEMANNGAEIIYVDQLSSIAGNRKKTMFERNTEHVEMLKHLKKEIGIPLVLLAQLNRGVEERAEKKPVLSDLKSTGQLEEDADVVMMGYRPALYEAGAESNYNEDIFWSIKKNRQGASPVDVEMYWDGARQKLVQAYGG